MYQTIYYLHHQLLLQLMVQIINGLVHLTEELLIPIQMGRQQLQTLAKKIHHYLQIELQKFQ